MKKLSWLAIAVTAIALLGIASPISARYLTVARPGITSEEFSVSAVCLAPGIPPAEYQLPLPGRCPDRNRVPVDDEFWGSGKGGRHSLDPTPTGDLLGQVWSRVISVLNRIAATVN